MAASPPASFEVAAGSQAERLGVDEALLDAVRRHVVDDARAVERQLVDPRSMDHERPLRTQSMDHLREPARGPGIADAEQLPARAGGVRRVVREG